MYPLNDNDLDRLSREAAEQYDVQPGTAGWEALENRLNKELPRKEEKDRRRFLFWLFFIVLLAGGGLLWTMTGKKSDPTIQLTGANAVPSASGEKKNIDPSTTTPSVGTDARKESATTTTETPIAGKETTQDQPPTVTATTNNGVPTDVAGTTTGKNSRKAGTTNPDKRDNSQSNNDQSKDQPSDQPADRTGTGLPVSSSKKKTGKQTPGKTTLAGAQPGNTSAGVTITDNTLDDTPKASLVQATGIQAGKFGPITAPPLPIPSTNDNSDKQQDQRKKNNQNRGLELGLVAGPDMSNVKFTDADKVGYNVGLQLGYRFNDRWSVSTGLLYTRKNYKAQGKDFTKPNNSWWQNREPVGLQGYCEMFDIPLNVRYDFSFNKKQRWFASAGASSYIMTGEYYDIDYIYTSGTTVRQSAYEKDSTTTYPFSILNISAGYERKLNSRFSLQVEPYFKLPLKGLGYGKLDLNSYGIYFSAKYKFGKR